MGVSANEPDISIERDLQRLDSVVANYTTYEKQKQQTINELKREAGGYVTSLEQYNYYKRLYDEYMKFDCDSAAHYANLCQNIAAKADMKKLEVSALLDKIYVVVTHGELLDAQKLMKDLPSNIDEMEDDIKMKYAITMLEFHMRIKMNFFWDSKGMLPLNGPEVWNKYGRYLPDNMWQKHYYESQLTRNDVLKELLADLKTTQFPSIKAAMLYIAIAQQYKYHGAKKEVFFHYLVLSAINDVMCANREASSLLFVANSPFVCAGTERAFNYAMLCTENARNFKDVCRSFDIVKTHAKITRAYQMRLEMNIKVCIVIVVLLAIAMVLVVFLMIKVRKKRKMQASLLKQIEDANVSLAASVEKEKQALEKYKHSNELLRGEIAYHNKNFISVYQLVTRYIADVQAFKKSLFNLITSGKIDRARKELKSQTVAESYLQNFFEHFDKAFLSSHPDFVTRFNKLLRPECAIVPPAADRLTPELRIYALVSMGITDSVSIADFLHYSTQTIYNYRLRVRHCACIPEKDFADTVARMYSDD